MAPHAFARGTGGARATCRRKVTRQSTIDRSSCRRGICRCTKGYHTHGAPRPIRELAWIEERITHCAEHHNHHHRAGLRSKGVRTDHHPDDIDQLSTEQKLRQAANRVPDSETEARLMWGSGLAVGFCQQCQCRHDWSREEKLDCMPPLHILQFGGHRIGRWRVCYCIDWLWG